MSVDTQEAEQEERERLQREREENRDPRVRAAKDLAAGDRGLEMVGHVAQGADLEPDEEVAALDYLLGAPQASVHEIEVQYETPAGLTPLTFVVRSIDTRKIDKIELRNLDPSTGQIDRLTADCEIVAAATIHMRDASGREVKLDSVEFLTVPRRGDDPFTHAAPPLALEERFRDQMGLISGVVLEIKRSSGYSPDRVKRAKRVLVSGSLG